MLIGLIGILVAFAVILFLVSKGADLALALAIGIAVAGIFLPLSFAGFSWAIIDELRSPVTVQLTVAVMLISGLGPLMKNNGDFDLVVSSLTEIFRSNKLLCILIPAFFGTLNVPGGALMSAPLVEESAGELNLSKAEMSAVNVFFRHIGYFIYPLYPSLILISELIAVDRFTIMKHNLLIMLTGLLAAYRFYFGGRAAREHKKASVRRRIGPGVINLILGFSLILCVLAAAVLLKIPFYLAVAIGILAALTRGLPRGQSWQVWWWRLKKFLTEWMDYKVGLVILGVMGFKGIIEHSGIISAALDSVVGSGASLPLLTAGAGLMIAYAVGVHLAASGLLAPVFALLFPTAAVGPYVSLLFTSILIGYIISPLHLCIVLSNEYYQVSLWEVYKKLIWPLLAMQITALILVCV